MITTFLQAHPEVSVLAVNDGSTDETLQLLQQLNNILPAQFNFLNLEKNAGKAEAVRQGMLKATTTSEAGYIGFWDADLSTPLEELIWFTDFSGGTLHHDIIMGSRIARLGSRIDRKNLRHYLGRVFATATSMILDLKVYDTQCGAKLFKREWVKQLFTAPFKSAWFFDVELLARYIQQQGHEKTYERVLEVPLNRWIEVKGTKLKTTDFLKVPFELLKIKRHYRL